MWCGRSQQCGHGPVVRNDVLGIYSEESVIELFFSDKLDAECEKEPENLEKTKLPFTEM